MDAKDLKEGAASVSKVKLVIGAASLFLFIVGVKRSFRASEEETEQDDGAAESPGQISPGPRQLDTRAARERQNRSG